jgi:cytochrome c-type biogenesis protein CcmH/NrfG
LSSLVVIATLVVLTVVAVYGAARPYRRSEVPVLEPLSDPLEDRRLALLISLRDLDAARFSGALEERDYTRLRTDTEGRMAKILRAIDRREHAPKSTDGPDTRRNPGRVIAVALILVAALGAGLVPNLLRSLQQREDAASAAPIEGGASIEFFRQRVREHPHDAAARIDLGQRYLDAGDVGDAYRQYVAALALAPRDVEALAHVGLLLHLSGSPAKGLRFERKALLIDPRYPEALFFEGVILLKGLERPREAIAPLGGYLEGSPFGSEGPTAQKLLREARREATRLNSRAGGG